MSRAPPGAAAEHGSQLAPRPGVLGLARGARQGKRPRAWCPCRPPRPSPLECFNRLPGRQGRGLSKSCLVTIDVQGASAARQERADLKPLVFKAKKTSNELKERGSERGEGLWPGSSWFAVAVPVPVQPSPAVPARAPGGDAGRGLSWGTSLGTGCQPWPNTTGFGPGTAACGEGTALSFPRETASLSVRVCAQTEGKYVPQRGGEDTRRARCFRGLPQGPGSGA